ncbi:hypothetical protein X975_25452, partial [Stegodyphus mimosarum]
MKRPARILRKLLHVLLPRDGKKTLLLLSRVRLIVSWCKVLNVFSCFLCEDERGLKYRIVTTKQYLHFRLYFHVKECF